jgi:hypothetical protein
MMVMMVMTVTTMPVATYPDGFGGMPRPCIQCASESLKAASPTMPFRTMIDVMPTCTVDRKRVGCSISFSAVAAPRSPSSAMACRRALRLEASPSSDMAKTPFSTVSSAIRRTSTGEGWENGTPWHFT